jgi:dTDP-4-dehydrorhamnose 3,5-epimerase
MPFQSTDFPGVLLFDPLIFDDNRGYFFESYNQKIFKDGGIENVFVQDNQSFSSFGVIRGLHFQLPPHAQNKLVRVLKGRILDVAVDLRKGSPTYGKPYCVEVTEENKKQVFIPVGFAHGFSVLSATAVVIYKCDTFYNKQSEKGVRFDDPVLDIDWKIPADKIIISDKDRQLPLLSECYNTFEFHS